MMDMVTKNMIACVELMAKRKGYKPVFATDEGLINLVLIAPDEPQCLVFVYMQGNAGGVMPAEDIQTKRAAIESAALRWLLDNGDQYCTWQIRFDSVALARVTGDPKCLVRWHEDALGEDPVIVDGMAI